MNLLITGKPGIGKTTLIQKIIANSNVAWGGFYTQEIREKDNRVGFQIIALNGKTGILAHIKYQSKFRVGKYYINIQDLDSIAVRAIEQAINEKKPILIDEIGKMELFSEKFKWIVDKALNATQPVLGTITMANLPFVDQVKQRPDVTIAELTSNNRTIMETMITDFLAEQGILYTMHGYKLNFSVIPDEAKRSSGIPSAGIRRFLHSQATEGSPFGE